MPLFYVLHLQYDNMFRVVSTVSVIVTLSFLLERSMVIQNCPISNVMDLIRGLVLELLGLLVMCFQASSSKFNV